MYVHELNYFLRAHTCEKFLDEKGSAFEWNFEHLSERRHETINTPEQQSKKTKTHPSFNKDKSYDDVVDDSNGLSDGLGENSDSDFQWLRDAV